MLDRGAAPCRGERRVPGRASASAVRAVTWDSAGDSQEPSAGRV